MCISPEERRQQVIDEEHALARTTLADLVERLVREHQRVVWESPEDLSSQPFHPLSRVDRIVTEIKRRVLGEAA